MGADVSRGVFAKTPKSKRLGLKLFVSTACLLFSFGCNNIGKLGNKLSFDLNDNFTNSSGGAFILQNVLPSQPTSFAGDYDLIGQNNEFDQFCPPANLSSCVCQYTFTQP